MQGNQYHFFKFLVSLVLLLAFNATVAEIFKWTDDQGRVHFTDKPPETSKAETVKLRINSFSSPSVEPFQFDEALISKRSVSQAVVMYSTSWCGYCKQARRYFQHNNIAFAEYDVEKSDKGKRDYKKMNGRGVPIILVGDKRMNGFSPGAFEKIYRQ